MGLVLFVVTGAFIGWLAAAVEEVDEGILARIGVGILGSLFGGLLLAIVGGRASLTDASWSGLVAGAVGAMILLGVASLSRAYKPHGPNAT